MPAARRFGTLVAFVHCLEATAQDEVLEVLEMLLHDLFGKAITAVPDDKLIGFALRLVLAMDLQITALTVL